VTAGPPRVLVADGAPASLAQVEAPLRRAGWNVLAVGSTSEVLRAVRDHDDVSVVLIDPDLPGNGVSGVDVVRALKAAPRFRPVPVFFLLRDGQSAPVGVPADGVFELDQLDGAALLDAIQTALRAQGLGYSLDGRSHEPAAATTDPVVASFGQEEVERIVREVARAVVPQIAERLIREEIQRLRREHGFEDPPR